MPREKKNKTASRVSVPAPTPAAPVQVPSPIHINTIEIERPGLFHYIKQGFGFSLGSSISRSIFGPSDQPRQSSTSGGLTADYVACMNTTGNTYQECKYFNATSGHHAPAEYIQCMRESKYDHTACKFHIN